MIELNLLNNIMQQMIASNLIVENVRLVYSYGPEGLRETVNSDGGLEAILFAMQTLSNVIEEQTKQIVEIAEVAMKLQDELDAQK